MMPSNANLVLVTLALLCSSIGLALIGGTIDENTALNIVIYILPVVLVVIILVSLIRKELRFRAIMRHLGKPKRVVGGHKLSDTQSKPSENSKETGPPH